MSHCCSTTRTSFFGGGRGVSSWKLLGRTDNFKQPGRSHTYSQQLEQDRQSEPVQLAKAQKQKKKKREDRKNERKKEEKVYPSFRLALHFFFFAFMFVAVVATVTVVVVAAAAVTVVAAAVVELLPLGSSLHCSRPPCLLPTSLATLASL